jgi:hypothetical protein
MAGHRAFEIFARDDPCRTNSVAHIVLHDCKQPEFLFEVLLQQKRSIFEFPFCVGDRAVTEVVGAARRLLTSLETTAPARDRAVEAEKARARSRARFGT